MISVFAELLGSFHVAARDGRSALVFFMGLLGNLHIVALLVAAVAAVFSNLSGRVKVLVLASVAVELLAWFGSSKLVRELTTSLVGQGYDKADAAFVESIAFVSLNSMLRTVALVLLVCAVFSARQSQSSGSR